VVHLASGAAARIPRRYRGRDIVAWFVDTGFFDQAVDTLPSPKARLLGNPQASGRNGGHDLNLHQFARDGIRLYGRLHGARDGRVFFAPDLKENLAKTDRIETDLIAMIDQYIERNAIDAPRETLPNLQDGYAVASIDSLDLQAEHIQTVIWAMGYTADYNLIQFPVSDADGFPLQHGGASDHPGLYFVGTHWLTKRKSAILFGVSEDAEYVAGRIAKK
jgi:putative flavoprotein involved in K+ transport